MKVTTRLRPRLAGMIGMGLFVVLPPALGAAYVAAVNAPGFEERNFYWMVALGLAVLLPLAPLLILFGCKLVTQPDPEALAKIDKLISELEYANQQSGDLYQGFADVREIAAHMKRRLDEAPASPTTATWRR